MKKQFNLAAENKKPERQVEAVKYEIKKYIARERRKQLPEGSDFWGFSCRLGQDSSEAEEIKISQINPMIDELVKAGKASFYIEILAQPEKKGSSSSPGQ